VTLVVAGKEKISTDYSDEEICDRFELLRKDADLSRRDIIAKLASEMGMPRKKVYRVINILFP